MEQEQKSLLCHSWKLVNGFCHSSCAFELTYVSQAVTCIDADTHKHTQCFYEDAQGIFISTGCRPRETPCTSHRKKVTLV